MGRNRKLLELANPLAIDCRRESLAIGSQQRLVESRNSHGVMLIGVEAIVRKAQRPVHVTDPTRTLTATTLVPPHETGARTAPHGWVRIVAFASDHVRRFGHVANVVVKAIRSR